jgi:hypothetical protein
MAACCMLDNWGYTRASTRQRARAPIPTTCTQKYVTLLFHGNSGFVSLPHCYVIRTLLVLLLMSWHIFIVTLYVHYLYYYWCHGIFSVLRYTYITCIVTDVMAYFHCYVIRTLLVLLLMSWHISSIWVELYSVRRFLFTVKPLVTLVCRG